MIVVITCRIFAIFAILSLIEDRLALAGLLSNIEKKVSYESLFFISPDYENTSDKQYSFLGVSIKNKQLAPSKTSFFNIEIDARYALGKPVLSYINLSEIYFYQSTENLNILYGRKKYNWSGLDQSWNLGFYEPRFIQNSLSPSEQGQIGIFFDNKNDDSTLKQNLNWTIFGSPIFLPDQGANYELNNGQFVASNPWFNAPPQLIQFNGQILPIDYKINTPKTNDIVFQSVYGAEFDYKFDSGYYVKTSYMSTPSHQVALSYKAVLVSDRVKVNVIPFFYREQNISLDAGYIKKWGSLNLFLIQNQPEKYSVDSNYNYPEINQSFSFGPQLNINLDQFKISASGISVNGGDVVDHGPDSGQLSSSLTSKYMYKKAYQIGLSYENLIGPHIHYFGEINWTEGLDNVIKILKLKNSINIAKDWNLYANILLVDTSDKVSELSYLQNLDQVTIGANYVF